MTPWIRSVCGFTADKHAQSVMTPTAPPTLRELASCDYGEILERMRSFTCARTPDTCDELWLVGHPPVFTLGQAGDPQHILDPGGIPVMRSDRGGQVTYHGPGQVVLYCLLDIRRRGIGARHLVKLIESAMIGTLAGYGIVAFTRRGAPGVYVERAFEGQLETRKLGSIGLRVTRGCCYHGMSLNTAMDLAPFARIDPCGFPGLRVTQIVDLGGPGDVRRVGRDLSSSLCRLLDRSRRTPTGALAGNDPRP